MKEKNIENEVDNIGAGEKKKNRPDKFSKSGVLYLTKWADGSNKAPSLVLSRYNRSSGEWERIKMFSNELSDLLSVSNDLMDQLSLKES